MCIHAHTPEMLFFVDCLLLPSWCVDGDCWQAQAGDGNTEAEFCVCPTISIMCWNRRRHTYPIPCGSQYAFLSGLAEPAAVVLLGLFFPSEVDKHLVDCLLAAVGGIMAFLALSELLPLAIEHAGRGWATASLFSGMALMSANLYVLHEYLGHEHEDGHAHAH